MTTSTHVRPGARRVSQFREVLSQFDPGHCIDLGAASGHFSFIAAEMGWTVDAVDVRDIGGRITHPSVNWVTADIRDVDLGPYDLALCLGVIYHLTLDDQHSLLPRLPPIVILDTHLDVYTDGDFFGHDLGSRVATGGHVGRWYREPDTVAASWENSASFWHTPDSLRLLFGRHGYSLTEHVPWTTNDRAFFIARRRE